MESLRQQFFHKVKPGEAVLYILAAVVLGIVLNLILNATGIVDVSPSYQEAYAKTMELSPLLQFLMYIILGPAVEEAVFRGAVFQLLRERVNAVLTIVISALVFGAVHANLVQFIYAFLMGILLAYAMERTRNLLLTFGMHAAANLAALLLPV